MKDYSKMSDFYINSAVAQLSLWKKKDCEEIHGDEKRGVVSWADGANWHVFDPCNNPSDAWPLIESNLICLMADVFCEPQDGGKWIAQPAYGWQHERVRNDNPLRAAMIVYLMMKDEEK